MGKVGVEPTMFLTSRIYSPLQSPTMLTFPNTFPVCLLSKSLILRLIDCGTGNLNSLRLMGLRLKVLSKILAVAVTCFLFFAGNLKPLFFVFEIFSDYPFYLPWNLSARMGFIFGK